MTRRDFLKRVIAAGGAVGAGGGAAVSASPAPATRPPFIRSTPLHRHDTFAERMFLEHGAWVSPMNHAAHTPAPHPRRR